MVFDYTRPASRGRWSGEDHHGTDVRFSGRLFMPLIPHVESAPLAPGLARGPGAYSAVVAIPARDEEERIVACLAALAGQSVEPNFAVLVLANNCQDRTVELVRAFGADAPFDLHLFDIRLSGANAHAGFSRRLAMNAAAHLLDDEGVLVTTDADSRADTNWLAENFAELESGADIVCGMICLDMAESAMLPSHVHQRGVLEYVYERKITELECRLDPLPWDCWPRHRMETGASLAMRAGLYVEVGGVPDVQPAEDRALVAMVRRHGGCVRHAFGPQVITSCRLDGRARGGWADDLAERVRNPDGQCHDVLEPAFNLYRRAALRHAMRRVWPSPDVWSWAARLRVQPGALSDLRALDFEDAWAEIENMSPRLKRRLVTAETIVRETQRIDRLLARVQAETVVDAGVEA
jgi:Glycosyl transferase family 2